MATKKDTLDILASDAMALRAHAKERFQDRIVAATEKKKKAKESCEAKAEKQILSALRKCSLVDIQSEDRVARVYGDRYYDLCAVKYVADPAYAKAKAELDALREEEAAALQKIHTQENILRRHILLQGVDEELVKRLEEFAAG